MQDSGLETRDALAALGRLPEEQQSLLLLIGVEDLSYEEAARVLGVPIGTVMSRLSRARQRLRAMLETGRPALLRRVKGPRAPPRSARTPYRRISTAGSTTRTARLSKPISPRTRNCANG